MRGSDPARGDGGGSGHYLKDELYELVRSDASIFEFLQAGSLDGLWYWDVDRQEQEWMSPAFKQLFGYTEDEIPNTSEWWQQNIHPDDLQVALENFKAHLEDPGHPYDQVVRYRHKDGSTVWVRCRGIAIRDDEGVPHRLLGAHTDLTQLMETKLSLERINRELRTAEEQFRTTFENAPIGMAIVSTEGRWIEVNSELCRILGYAREQLLAADFQSITHPEDLDADLSLVADVLEDRIRNYQMEKRYRRGDGSYVQAMLSVSLVRDEDGEPVHFVSQIEDISERKRIEADLKRSNAELEQVAYVASHDLRAPLRQVRSALELLQRHLGEEAIDDKGRELIGIADRSSARMTNLIDDLLSLARLEAESGERERLELSELIAELSDPLAPKLEDCGGTITVEGELPVVLGDPSQIRQLFQNLLENAVKYRSEERPLAITVTATPGHELTRINVADTGIGVAPDATERVFEMFTRLHGVGEYEGTGIGLALVSRIASLHGGRAGVESDGESGSTFWAELPAA